MNTEPVRTNGKIVAALVGAIVASGAALEAALLALLLALGVESVLAQASVGLLGVVIVIVGTTVAILKGAEATREHTTAWDATIGAVTPGPSDEPVVHEVPTDDGAGIG